MKWILTYALLILSVFAFSQQETKLVRDSIIKQHQLFGERPSSADKEATAQLPETGKSLVQGEPKDAGDSFTWLFFLLLFCLLLVAIAKLSTGMSEIWQGVFNLNIFLQFYRDRILGRSVGSFLLSLNYYLAFSMLIFLFLKWRGFFASSSDYFLIGACFIALIAFENLRLLTIYVTGRLFDLGDYLGFHVFNTRFTNRIAGLLLLPVIALALFGNEVLFVPLLWIGLAVIATSFAYRSYRSLFVSNSVIIGNWFHFILYICSLEIAPFVLMIRAVSIHS